MKLIYFCLKSMKYELNNIIKGGIIYSVGDTIAALLLGEFIWFRLVGMSLIGMTVYAFEIPNYFKWIDKKTQSVEGVKLSLYKTILAILYFNPLWIARHLLFILLISGKWSQVDWNIIKIASISFVINIPISFLANFIIQNKIPLKGRFVASAIFSGLMAIYYAMSTIWFS